jgi:streptogramin lyase
MLRTTFVLALALAAAPLFAGSFERVPLPRTVGAKVMDIAPADTYAWVIPDRAMIARATLDGTVVDAFPLPTFYAQQVTLDPVDGSAWYANYTRVGHVSLTGEITQFEIPFSVYDNLLDLQFGPDDHLWLTRSHTLTRVSRTGESTVFDLTPWSFDPSVLAMGVDGNIWVAGHYANAIGRMTPDGTFTVFSNGAEDADYPNGLAAGPDGNLWFSSNYGKLKKISTAGTITEVFPNTAPRGMIVSGTDGRLWFGSAPPSAIQRYEIATNTVLATYPVETDSPWIWPIAASTSGVWWTSASETLNRIDYDGVVHQTPFLPLGPEPFAMAASVQYVWFVAPEQNQIGRTNPTNGHTDLYDLPHAASRPRDIAAGPNGMWFTEETGDRIGRIDANGVITEFNVLSIGGKPTGIAMGPDGNMWFTLAATDKIGRITPAGVVSEFPLLGIGRYPNSIVAGPDASLWFTMRDAGKVGRITTAGVVTEFPAGGTQPGSIVSAPDGNLWFTSHTFTHRLTTAGVMTTFERLDGTADELTVGPDGALWGNTLCCFGVTRTSLDGTSHYYTLPPGVSGSGITTGPDGKIWFSDSGAQALYRLNPDPPIIGTGQTICHDAGMITGVLASFVDPDATRAPSEYNAYIDWGMGQYNPYNANNVITQTSPGHFDVSSQGEPFTNALRVVFKATPKAGTLGQTASAIVTIKQITGTANRTSFYNEGGSGELTLAAPGGGCGWTVSDTVNWITWPNGTSGTGDTIINFDVAPNNTGSPRSAIITAGGKSIPITQSATPTPQSSLYLVTPCRFLDTRDLNYPIGASATWELTASGHCGIPEGAHALVANITAVNPQTTGWLALYAAAQPWPGVSTMNYRAGRTRANNAIVPLFNGGMSIYNGGDLSVHFIIDVTGYFK